MPQLQDNDQLSYNFVDTFRVGVRSDGIIMIKFYLNTPDGPATEQARIVTTKDGIQKLLDVVCNVTNYYPEKKNISSKDNKIGK